MAAAGRRRAEQQRSRTPALLVVVAAVAAAVTVIALVAWPDGSGAGGSPGAAGSPTPSPSRGDAPIDLSGLPIARDLECAALDDEAVATALGGAVTTRDGYTDGDRVEVAPGVTDVAHETSCSFATDAAQARVWVFSAPVSTADARDLVRERRRQRGCTFPDLPTGFGTPGVISVCTDPDPDRSVSATMSGLFGDAWLSCRLSQQGAPIPDAVLERAERWCVHVATTLGAVP
ncbi:MAG: hypothetical protein ACTHKG_20495 [Nocardioides sp.]